MQPVSYAPVRAVPPASARRLTADALAAVRARKPTEAATSSSGRVTSFGRGCAIPLEVAGAEPPSTDAVTRARCRNLRSASDDMSRAYGTCDGMSFQGVEPRKRLRRQPGGLFVTLARAQFEERSLRCRLRS